MDVPAHESSGWSNGHLQWTAPIKWTAQMDVVNERDQRVAQIEDPSGRET